MMTFTDDSNLAYSIKRHMKTSLSKMYKTKRHSSEMDNTKYDQKDTYLTTNFDGSFWATFQEISFGVKAIFNVLFFHLSFRINGSFQMKSSGMKLKNVPFKSNLRQTKQRMLTKYTHLKQREHDNIDQRRSKIENIKASVKNTYLRIKRRQQSTLLRNRDEPIVIIYDRRKCIIKRHSSDMKKTNINRQETL